jgi:hypothetical protein
MKKTLRQRVLLGIGLLALAASPSFAQDLSINSYETTILGDNNAPKLEVRLGVENNGSTALDVGAYRVVLSEISGSKNQFCWTECYNYAVDTATGPISIPAGGCVDDFWGYYEPEGLSGQTIVKYCFYEYSNVSDTICTTITYDADSENAQTPVEAVCGSPTGIDHFDLSKVSMGNAQPNPANNTTYINYDMGNMQNGSRLFLYDMLGVVRKEVKLNEPNGRVKIDVSNLPVGMYFYSLEVSSEVVSTKRLLIVE